MTPEETSSDGSRRDTSGPDFVDGDGAIVPGLDITTGRDVYGPGALDFTARRLLRLDGDFHIPE